MNYSGLKKSVLILSAAILLSLKLAHSAFATIYQPGETLNPSCSPNDAVCRVATPAASGANSDITSLTGITTPLPVSEGGIGLSSVPTGALIYGAGSNTFSALAIGTTSQVLTVSSSGLPIWTNISAVGYDHWSLQTNGTGTTNISSANTVNFVNGVGISLSQTGSNVTINTVQNIAAAASPTFAGLSLSNTSNQLAFGVSGSKTTISANTQTADRVVTIPAITANDSLVLNNNSATLTNKTIAAGNNTITGLTTSNLSAGASIANSQLATPFLTIETLSNSGLQGGGTVGLGQTLSLSIGASATPGTYGSATQIPIITIDQHGNITSVAPTTISGLTSSNLSATANITNAQLANNSISINAVAGTGIGISGSPVSLGGSLTINGINATSTVKGVASFDSTNLLVTSGSVNTIQDINTAASPTFNSTTLTNRLFVTSTTNQLSLGATNTTTISATAPSSSRIANIPGLTANDTFAFIGQTQTFTNKTIAAGSNTITGLTNSNLSGAAAITDVNLATITTANKVSGSAVQLNSNGGLVNSTGLSMLRTCADNQILKWTASGGWACANDNTGGTPAVYSDGGLLSDGTGLSLLRTCLDGQILKWTSATGWTCESDNVSAGIGTLKATDNSISLTPQVIQLGPPVNSSDEFIISDIGSSTARVRTGTKVVLTDASQTLTNKTISAIGNTITGLTNSNLLSGSAAITDNNLSTITTANKVSGSAVQLATGGGLTNNSGLSLLTTCADGDMLIWNNNTSAWECSAGDTNPLNTITAAVASNTANNADFAQIWNWSLTTAAKTAFTFGENTASTNGAGSQYILGVSTKAGSTAAPLKVVAQNNTIFDTTSSGGITIGSLAAGQGITIDGGVGTLNFGASSNDKTINIGSNIGASPLTMLVGTGGFSLNGTGSSSYSIGTSTTTGTFTLGGASQTGTANLFASNGGMAINLGTGSAANNITIGNTTTTTVINLQTGTGNINLSVANGNGVKFSTSTANDDLIRIAPGLNGGAASFQGTITSADLTAARTWTLPNNSGAVPLSTLGNNLFFTTSGNTTLTLPTSGTVTALGNSTTGTGSTLVLATSPTFNTSIFTPLVIGGALANNTLTLSGNNASSGNSPTGVNTIFNVGDSNTTVMAILNNGYVGIGTTAPAGPLEIISQNDFMYLTKYSNDIFVPGFVGRKARGTITAPLAVQAGDGLASISGRGYDGTSFPTGVLTSSGSFQVTAGEDFTSTNKGTYLTFIVTPLGSTTRSERMRLTAAGALEIYNTSNQLSLGATNASTTISATAPSANRIATIPGLTTDDTFAFVGQTQTFTSLQTFTNGIGASGSVNLTSSSGVLSMTGLSASSITTSAGNNFTLSTGTTGNLSLDSGTVGSVLIGTGANAKIISIGNTVSTTTLNFASGTGGINIGTAGVGKTISIGTGAAVNTLLVGSTNSSSSVTLSSGTGGINIGTEAIDKTISIGSTTGASTLNLISGTGGINIGTAAVSKTISIGTGAANNTINIGTTNDGSTTNIISGTGNINFNVSGSNVSGKVIIGNSGTTTPDLLVLDNGTTDPTGTNGGMYYNTTTGKFRCFEGSTWRNCVGSAAQQAGTTFALTTLGTGSSLLTTFNVTPTTSFGDVYVHASIYTNSLNNTDQTITVQIRSGTTCAGTLLASATSTLTSPNGANGPGVFASTLINNAGTTAQNYAICASSSLNGGAQAGGTAEAQVIDTGADLAEMYTTNDTTMEIGDVVAVDSFLKTGVKKSQVAYDPTTFGVISTRPGILIGNAENEGVKTLPVALSGRVPVKVNAESGPIHAGDALTTSSTPGVAMKALKSGTIIGIAMVDYDGQGAGTILAFIKNSQTNGVKADSNLTSADILSSLIQQNSQIVPATVNLSEINTDKAIAGVEMITPKITVQDILATNATISGTLTVDTLKANKIVGLGTIEQKLIDLQSQISTVSGVLGLSDLEATGTAKFKGSVEFQGPAIFKTIAEFMDKTIFRNRVQFADKDMGGAAIIKQSTSEVEVKFDKPYEQIPIVNISLVYEGTDTPTFTEDGEKAAVAYLNRDGFKIILPILAARDFKYHWTALNIKDAKTSVIDPISTPAPTPVPTLVPTITPAPTTEPTPTPVTDLTPTPTETALPTPTPAI